MNDGSAAEDERPTPVTPREPGRRRRGFAQKAAVTLVVLAGSFVAVPAARAADCTPGSYPPAQCAASLSSTVVPVGGSLTVSGPGFASESSVSIDLLSTVVHLKTAEAEDNGTVTAEVDIPRRVDPGTHTIRLTGKNPDGSVRQLAATIQIVGGDDNGSSSGESGHGEAGLLASTGASGTLAIEVASGVLVGGGALTLLLVRGRRRRTSAG
ncbi:hypothetical protein [Streptacidiphilus sp. EB129]|jgi:hypothetical protein|uniref:hypothetical protein n=1 Tax=Streptacidiphilus sp. EB129 TaxID=3156262 RepID=UPI00351448BB